jgi:hypothetical protein
MTNTANNSDQPDDIWQGIWFEHLIAESDRGCVLIAHSMIQDILCDIIEKHIFLTIDTAKDFVTELREGRPNPIGTFKATIDYARSREIITKKMFHILEIINSIRNSFAHYKPSQSSITPEQAEDVFKRLIPFQQERSRKGQQYFTTKHIKEKFPVVDTYSDARKSFMASVLWVIVDLIVLGESSVQ